jgi:hypothetical protein
MKKTALILTLSLSLLFTPATAYAAPQNNPIFTTLSAVQQLINSALQPIQQLLSSLDNRTGELENKVSDLEERLAAIESSPSASPSPLACISPPSGMVGWWTGDGNTQDIVGPNDGSTNNGAGFTIGKVGQGFSFDGVDDYVQVPTAGFPTENNDRTLDLWVYINAFLEDVSNPNSPNETFFAGYGNFGSGGQSYSLGTAGNILYFSNWGSALFGPSLQTNTWYHVTVTNDDNIATLYLNGSAVATGSATINTPSGTSMYIGKIPDPLGTIRRLNGFVDEVELFNRALTPTEIQTIYNAGSFGKCKN